VIPAALKVEERPFATMGVIAISHDTLDLK
jgi:hypothetical protein